MPPSHQEILSRMEARGMTQEQITQRLRDDPVALQSARFYDFVVVNHENEEKDTSERILAFVNQRKEKCRHFCLQKEQEYSRILHMQPSFFATTNKNKLREASQILGRDIEQLPLDLLEPQEVDVEVVVKVKAEDAFHKSGKMVMVEDTGLEFSAWGKMPGALIKWFMDEVGNEGILKMMSGETNRKAIAKTAIAFFDGTQSRVFTGTISGTIPEKITGTGGFGWDPIFIPDGYTKSFAEMSDDEKNAISMRKLAFEKMKDELK